MNKDNITPPKQQKIKPFPPWPWWVSLVLGSIIYIVCKYVLPTFDNSPEPLRTFSRIGSQIAPVLTIPFLLLAARQLYDNIPPNEESNPDEQ